MHLNNRALKNAHKNANIYDFLDEIDESADDLYKIHTGRKIFGDRIPSPDNISTSDFDDENKPPPFPYNYVMSNLVEYNESHPPKLTQIKEGKINSVNTVKLTLANMPEITEVDDNRVLIPKRRRRARKANLTRIVNVVNDAQSIKTIIELPERVSKGELGFDNYNEIQSSIELIGSSDIQAKERDDFESSVLGSAIQAAAAAARVVSNAQLNQPNTMVTAPISSPRVTCKSTASKSNTMNPQTPETIAKSLRKALLTPGRCLVCNVYRVKERHYRQADHFHAIRTWIDRELAKVEKPVDAGLIFCEPCHLPLSGNESSQKHYLEASHNINMKTFCSICLRVIVEKLQMAEHRQSKQHQNNLALSKISVGATATASNDRAQPPGTSTVGTWEAFKDWEEIKRKKNENGKKESHSSTNSINSVSTNSRIVKLAAASQLQITINGADFCGPSKELNNTGAFDKQEQENTDVEEQPNISTFKKTVLKETDETCNLSNWELQRLVLLEQLELVRLQKEKERVLLNSAWWDCGQK